MKRRLDLRRLIAFLMVIFVFGAVGGSAQVKKKPVLKKKVVVKRPVVKKPVAPKLYTISAGTRLRVRMDQTISSKTARVGDTFTTTVTDPVYSTSGGIVIPVGSKVRGRVDSVKAAAKGGKVGEIDVSFYQVELPNSVRRAVNGSLTDLISDDAKSDSEGTASGDKTKHRKIIFIGGGAGGGAILGGAIGGGKGAVIGGIAGALGGLIAEKSTKGEEAEVKSGIEFGIYLNQSITLPKFVEVNP
jgi:hypothetical protein